MPSFIRTLYRRMDRVFGALHWWPGRTAFEVITGAILTQNTSWTQVEKALDRLRKNRVLTVRGMRDCPETELAGLIRASGYYNQKARKLKTFIRFLDDSYGGRLVRMGKTETGQLRQELLAVNGIGPETADSILLYAFGRPVFVVDAYTQRLFERLGLLRGGERYEDIRRLVEYDACTLPDKPRTAYFNQFHALIVNLGKEFCRKRNPRCSACPLYALHRCPSFNGG